MTDRKPPGMSTGSWIDAQIGAAMKDGAFDNLPGAGKPLPGNQGQFDPDFWVRQLAKREGVSFLPPSMELKQKVGKALETIGALPDEAAVRACVSALNAEIAKMNATVLEGPPTNVAMLDVEQVIARWLNARSKT